MKGTESMMKPGMHGTWTGEMCHTQLGDPPKSLKVWVLNQIIDYFKVYTDKSINRIVKNLVLIHEVRVLESESPAFSQRQK
jgi:hypothetical protein